MPAPVTLHVTAVFAAFTTVAANCCPCPPYKLTVAGVTVTPIGGLSVIVAVAVFVPSATLVAVTVTVLDAVTVAGAV